jgi:hypothetical protein
VLTDDARVWIRAFSHDLRPRSMCHVRMDSKEVTARQAPRPNVRRTMMI